MTHPLGGWGPGNRRPRSQVPNLPAELWHLICSHLKKPEDLTNFRCTCQTFSEYGLPAALRDIFIFAHPYQLTKLSELACDPSKAAQVRSIAFAPSVIQPIPYEDEEKDDLAYDRIRAEFNQVYNPIRKFYPTFQEFNSDPRRLSFEEIKELVFNTFADVLPKLGGLQRVSIETTGQGLRDSIGPKKLWRWFFNFNDASCTSIPKNLRLVEESVRWLGRRRLNTIADVFEDYESWAVKALLGPLRNRSNYPSALRVSLESDLTVEALAQIPSFAPSGLLTSLTQIELNLGFKDELDGMPGFLAALPSLQSLTVVGQPWESDFAGIYQAGHHWPSLRFIALHWMMINRVHWLGFLELHSKHLEEVLLDEIDYRIRGPKARMERQWRALEVVPEMKRCLGPKIRKVIIAGELLNGKKSPTNRDLSEGEEKLRWWLGDVRHRNGLRDKLSRYFTHDEEMPLNAESVEEIPSQELTEEEFLTESEPEPDSNSNSGNPQQNESSD